MKILVVDDEKLLVKGIRFNLENEGYDVITGSDGMEAVELAGSENPDLIVLDLMMPRLDGLEACGKIREFSDVPIIMLTAKADDMDKLMGLSTGRTTISRSRLIFWSSRRGSRRCSGAANPGAGRRRSRTAALSASILP